MNKIKKLRKFFKSFMIDGYLVPKNDDYFNEYISQSNDRLKFISNFSGSAGFAIILKNKNFLFVDGRYTLQANIESGKNFKIFEIPKTRPFNILKIRKDKIKLGFDPKLFTEISLKSNFRDSCDLIPISNNLIDEIFNEGALILGSGHRSIRFRPHLNIKKSEIDIAVDIIRRALLKLKT